MFPIDAPLVQSAMRLSTAFKTFWMKRLSIDDELMDVVEALSPQNISNLSKENVKAIQQVLLPDFELREVSRST